jgi:hypothetical protein
MIGTLHYFIFPTPLGRGMDEDYVPILVKRSPGEILPPGPGTHRETLANDWSISRKSGHGFP